MDYTAKTTEGVPRQSYWDMWLHGSGKGLVKVPKREPTIGAQGASPGGCGRSAPWPGQAEGMRPGVNPADGGTVGPDGSAGGVDVTPARPDSGRPDVRPAVDAGRDAADTDGPVARHDSGRPDVVPAPDATRDAETPDAGTLDAAVEVPPECLEPDALNLGRIAYAGMGWREPIDELPITQYTTDIFIANPDGTEVINTTNTDDASEHLPSFFPDGQAIVYNRTDEPGEHFIDVVRLSSNLPFTTAAWGASTKFDIWRVNIDGSNPQNLTSTPEIGEFSPKVSPDGSKILFTNHLGQMEVMDVNGLNRRRVFPDTDVEFMSSPSWFSDSQHFIYAEGRILDNVVMKIGNIDDPEDIVDVPNPDGHAPNLQPVLTPDESQIVYRRGGGFDQIYAMNRDGSNQRRISFAEGIDPSFPHYFPSVSPNGEWVVTQATNFLESRPWGVGVLTIVRIDGSEEFQMFPPLGTLSGGAPAWSSSTENDYCPAGIEPVVTDGGAADAAVEGHACDPDGDGIITDEFTDPALLAAVREALGIAEGDDITLEDVRRVEILVLNGKSIRDISGIECFTNLRHLELGHNEISDLEPLSGLTNLTALNLNFNDISDIAPLFGLTNLNYLHLRFNNFSDLTPLSGLTNLTGLYLDENQISDLTFLSGLTNLEYLHLSFNNISDITPLADLTNLIVLNLGYNLITDIAALLDNAGSGGLGDGDQVFLVGNDEIPTEQVEELVSYGVEVE